MSAAKDFALPLGVLVLGGIVVAGFLFEKLRAVRLRRYFARRAPRPSWESRFPEVPRVEMDRFIDIFVDSFSRLRACRDRLSPDDGVMELYALVNKDAPCDELELVCWPDELQEIYHIDIYPHWRDDITLGEVFCTVAKLPMRKR